MEGSIEHVTDELYHALPKGLSGSKPKPLPERIPRPTVSSSGLVAFYCDNDNREFFVKASDPQGMAGVEDGWLSCPWDDGNCRQTTDTDRERMSQALVQGRRAI